MALPLEQIGRTAAVLCGWSALGLVAWFFFWQVPSNHVEQPPPVAGWDDLLPCSNLD
jgi:hypothetical protein